MARVIDVLRKVVVKARPSYLAAFESGDSLFQQHGITTPDRLAHFLAQVLHESGGLTLEHESMNYSAERLLQIFGVGRHSAAITPVEARSLARDERAIAERVYGLGNPRKAQELGNTNPGDGFKFRGGGLMQTTGRCNYRRMGQVCGVDFENSPDLVLSPDHALKPALVEWSAAGLNIYADNNDILAISRAINCGSPKSRTMPNGMQNRATWFAEVRPLVNHLEFRTVTEVKSKSAMPEIQAIGEPRSEFKSGGTLADLLGERILRARDEGPLVRALQRALARLGYPLRGSASFAEKTLRAVKDFQKVHGLEVDGEVGRKTAEAIDHALAERSSTTPNAAATVSGLIGGRILRIGDAGPIVKAVQLELARLGYPLKGTGNFGPATERAVRDFQARHTLEVDGELGPEVASAIDCALAAREPPAAPSPVACGHSPSATDKTCALTQPTQIVAGSLVGFVGNVVLGLGVKGSAVTALQLVLAKLGYQLRDAGHFGGATEAAIMDFQERCGLEVDGEVGPETARALDEAIVGARRAADPALWQQRPQPPPPWTDPLPLWVIEGLKWLNLREGQGAADNSAILNWAKDEGGAIELSYKHDSIPWCALFANMVLTKVGIEGTETLWALD